MGRAGAICRVERWGDAMSEEGVRGFEPEWEIKRHE